MTIKKGQAWGERRPLPPDGVVVSSDAEARVVLEEYRHAGEAFPTLGLLGGGGSILTVPIFVYVGGFAAKSAVAMSLPVVGATSLIGAVSHWRKGNVDLRAALVFGAFAMVGAFAGACRFVWAAAKVLWESTQDLRDGRGAAFDKARPEVALVEAVLETVPPESLLYHGRRNHVSIWLMARSEFELAKARDRAHILEGLLKALSSIDMIIQTIRSAPDAETARAAVNGAGG